MVLRGLFPVDADVQLASFGCADHMAAALIRAHGVDVGDDLRSGDLPDVMDFMGLGVDPYDFVLVGDKQDEFLPLLALEDAEGAGLALETGDLVDPIDSQTLGVWALVVLGHLVLSFGDLMGVEGEEIPVCCHCDDVIVDKIEVGDVVCEEPQFCLV